MIILLDWIIFTLLKKLLKKYILYFNMLYINIIHLVSMDPNSSILLFIYLFIYLFDGIVYSFILYNNYKFTFLKILL